MSLDGLLIVDKPAGITSHGVVARVRKALGIRRVGHAGTLDPMATGVLVLGVGRGTRLLGHLALHDKEYLATIRLGARTVTDDVEGDVLARATPQQVAAVSDEGLAAAMVRLTGEISQVPTAVSAIKVDGQRAHRLVRAGAEVQLAPRAVTVARFDLLDLRRSPEAIDLDVAVTCSTGTYVRALARDLGEMLDTGGHLTALRRTRVGAWTEDQAVPLDALSAAAEPGACVIGIDEAARRSFQTRTLGPVDAQHARHGRPIAWGGEHGVVALIDESGHVLALAKSSGDRAEYLAVLA